ncbi:hypothetical protein GCM10010136_01310 [Limoniibacter endophyticus]|uniref:Uncharacterized protein n=1 Tax=Limoniibacter endophyticus TaxID=1565040 RepID=A0A8J3DJC3_9HYPH|nr:hypothetical protein GCM10010136_01310 [Limoniibacter endophyticus]
MVETLFRNGTLTVVGIILSFSLGFVTQWANNPIPWTLRDLPTLILLIGGIVLQIMTLGKLLRTTALQRRVYDKANKQFLVGVCLTALGVASAIVIDFFEIVTK